MKLKILRTAFIISGFGFGIFLAGTSVYNNDGVLDIIPMLISISFILCTGLVVFALEADKARKVFKKHGLNYNLEVLGTKPKNSK